MGQKQRSRFRSNVFHPKVKQPLSFELTRRGRSKLKTVMTRCEVSLGDLVEYFVRVHGDACSGEAIEQAARRKPVVADIESVAS